MALPLQVKSLVAPLKAGQKATLVAATAPGATATITVYLKTGTSKAQGLEPKVADATGNLTWTWTVEPTLTPGAYRVVVTATSGGKTSQAETIMTVQ